MKKICVVGSVNVDTTLYLDKFPLKGETIKCENKLTAIGGKGFNQAIAAYRSGADVMFYTSVGNDNDAQFVKDTIKRVQLPVILDEIDNSTGSAFILVEKSSQNEIIINEGANGNNSPSALKDNELDRFDIIILQNEIPESVNKKIIDKYGKTKTIIYNPAPSRKIDVSLLKNVAYLTPNEVEICKITGLDFESSINFLLEKGVKNLLITLGKEGCLFVNEKERFMVPAFKVKAVDTVAAGDTFIGYFASGLANGVDIKEALKISNAASALTVSNYGAEPSIPFKNKVEDFLKNN